LIIGNIEAKIGVCTLWSPREKFIHRHLNDLMKDIALVGNLYSVFGVGILIRNYLANPKMQYLIVAGTELGLAKTVLKNLGKDDSLPAKLFLEPEHIARFLEQVEIIYTNDVRMLFKEKESGFVARSKTSEPIIIPLPEPKNSIFPAPNSGHFIRTNTISEGYCDLLKEIRTFGHITGQDSEGHRRQELWELNMVITSQNPTDFHSVPHPEYDAPYIKEYCEAFWEGTEPSDLAYRYGHIIRFSFGDQIESVIKAFIDKAETFRTVISLWDPRINGGSITADDPPCLTLIHPRIIGRHLHQWAYIRTNDMFGGWPLNAIALRYFQYKILEKLKIELKRPELELGELGITSGSAHIYERDWVRIDAMLAEQKSNKFFPDPKGNFEIRTENEEIIVRHFNPSGDMLLQTFNGKNAEELSKEIAPFISEIRNALYIGRELQKAEIKTKNYTPEDK